MNKKKLPVLPLRDTVPFPKSIVSVLVGRGKSIKALNKSLDTDRMIFLVAQKDPEDIEVGPNLLCHVGVDGHLLEVLHLPDGSAKVVVESGERLEAEEYLEKDGAIFCEAHVCKMISASESSTMAYMRILRDTFERFSTLSRSVPMQILDKVKKENDLVLLIDVIAQNLPLQFREKQAILEEKDLVKRAEFLDSLIHREIELIEIEGRIRMRVKTQLEKSNKEFYLNEQMKAIQKEMGREDSHAHELSILNERIKKARLPKVVEEKAQIELKNLKSTPVPSAEGAMIRHYIDWILALPWKKYSKSLKNLSIAENILEEDHYGLQKVKERIIEHLAVQIRDPKSHGSVLCLVGPPGVGKTSLTKSIARAMGKKFVRISLGGMRDEAELRGHRRTYVGAMPGRIIQSLKKVGIGNPVILLDEIDKVGHDWRGDPASALLEILDPEQNTTFNDHYLELDYDLSNIMFIATANTTQIPRPLLDRLEIIRVSGYTELEKLSIAEKYLVPKHKKEHLLPDEWILSRETLTEIIRYYTRESGVRELSRMIATCARKTVRSLVDGQELKKITNDNLADFLGIRKFLDDSLVRKNQVGIVCGLAWTEVGGEVLMLESVLTPGKGKVIKTGKLGDVMKESIQAAESFIKSRSEKFGINPEMWFKKDIHLHVPEGATPKDGPSAGVGMVTSIVSLLTNNPVRHDIAMTGEITLSGRVLAIGGLKEKTLAALRYGIKTVLIPKDNEKDLSELPEEIRSGLEIILVSQIEEVLQYALLNHVNSITKHSVEKA